MSVEVDYVVFFCKFDYVGGGCMLVVELIRVVCRRWLESLLIYKFGLC